MMPPSLTLSQKPPVWQAEQSNLKYPGTFALFFSGTTNNHEHHLRIDAFSQTG